MSNYKFTEKDKESVVEFLNFIATKAIFNNWKTADSLKHFKLLAHMQQVILPKIDANIFEVGELILPKDGAKSTQDPSKKDE